jgi:WbqC-like protein family
MKTVGVIQSNYIPWKGYFDIVHDVDLFVFHDDLLFTKLDWRNRNIVKTASGPRWLTIPVGAPQKRLICEIDIKDRSWTRDHWSQLTHHYGRAPHFKAFAPLLKDVYLDREWTNLSAFNQYLITRIARECLGVTTEFRDSRELSLVGQKQDRLLDLLGKVGADAYVSGPTARGYIDEGRFEAAGIRLIWKDYAGYPVYPQLYPPFSHEVTILDLLFHVGAAAPHYIWGWRAQAAGPSSAAPALSVPAMTIEP